MDAWGDVSSSTERKIYTGIWTNWSRGPVFGATLTLTQQNGNLVIAFAAFFLTIVATSTWRIACLCMHRFYSTSSPRGAWYHQLQVILRNSPSPQSGLWRLFRLRWSHNRRQSLQTIPAASLAAALLGGFTVATYFLPVISTSTGTEVLILPGNCGLIDNSLFDPPKYYTLLLPESSALVASAANYAQQCYGNNSGSLDCAEYVKTRIPSMQDIQASCPFDEKICQDKRIGLSLTTGLLDTSDVFGLNNPQNERTLFSTSIDCGVLKTEGYTSTRQSALKNYTQFHYGAGLAQLYKPSTSGPDGLFEIHDSAAQYEPFSGGYPYPARNYQVQAFIADLLNGSAPPSVEFMPVQELMPYGGDLVIAFLIGNGVLFTEPSADPWYKATRVVNTARNSRYNTSDTVFAMEGSASPLACIQRFQFCHTSLPANHRCGPVGSLSEAILGAKSLAASNKTLTQLTWVFERFITGVRFGDSLRVLGPASLASYSNLSGGLQGPIATNQWQVDLTRLWATYLAAAQELFIYHVVGPRDPRLRKYVRPFMGDYDDATYENICRSQKIRSAAYMSFSLFGLYFFFIGGSLVVIVSYTIEPILSYLHQQRKLKQYSHFEWISNESLQLHRLAHEGLGWGTWKGATEDVPTTLDGELLSSLDLKDPSHPRLCVRQGQAKNGSEETAPRNDMAMVMSTPHVDEEAPQTVARPGSRHREGTTSNSGSTEETETIDPSPVLPQIVFSRNGRDSAPNEQAFLESWLALSPTSIRSDGSHYAA